jgi:hypothetical protein
LAGTGAKIVVANIPNVTVIPFLVPAPAFQAACQFLPPAVSFTDFLVPNVVDPTKSTFNICTNYAIRSGSLIAQASAAVNTYNAIIAVDAAKAGAVVVDVNGLLARLAKNGYEVGGRHLTTAFGGGLFSLDAIHPTNTGYAILANEFLKTMNSKLHTGIPAVSVEMVAKNDPLVFAKLQGEHGDDEQGEDQHQNDN